MTDVIKEWFKSKPLDLRNKGKADYCLIDGDDINELKLAIVKGLDKWRKNMNISHSDWIDLKECLGVDK